jgi:aldehyde dehydrogenase (NAD+)
MPEEKIVLTNNTHYGLGGSELSGNINLAFDIAGKIKADALWVNCHNMIDAAVGFGGYRQRK